MKRLGIWLILLIGLQSCQKNFKTIKDADQFISSEYHSIIKINELNDLMSQVDNNVILHHIYIYNINRASQILKNLNPNSPTYMANTKSKDSVSGFLIVTKNHDNLFLLDSIPNHKSELLEKSKMLKVEIDSMVHYQEVLGDYFIASNKKELIDVLKSDYDVSPLTELLNTSDDNVIVSTAFKDDGNNYSQLMLSKFEDTIANKISIDVKFSENNLSYNGIIKGIDSSRTFIDCFKNSIPKSLDALNIIPSNAQDVIGITYDDYSTFSNNHKTLYGIEKNDLLEIILNYTDEITKVDDELVLHSLSPELILESIEDKELVELFRDAEIYRLSNNTIFKNQFYPFFDIQEISHFAVIKEFVVFSNSIENLQSIISSAINNNTLKHSEAFKYLSENLSDEVSLFIFKNSKGISEVFEKDLKGYDANAVQLIYESGYAHINGVIQKFSKRPQSNSVSTAFTTGLNTQILSPPQTVKNHVTKSHDIVVQDVNNVLYLISNTGKVLWQKQLHGRILGTIEQVDMYKNGRLQLAFVTAKRLYVLDRNGNNVSPFPLKFNDEITQPLSVFDYDKNRNFRLLVTQGNNLLMYDAKGKSIKGFNYSSNNLKISSQPKHFRVGSKDYIVFKTGDKLRVINRRGKTRINVNNSMRYSNNEVFLYKNQFTSTNTMGELVQIDTRGRVSRKNLNLPENHIVEATSKTLVSLTENKLNIKSRTVDLDYGDYTAPRIFYLNDKIYVTTTDLQTKKVYLFDSQAKPIPNFPVYGTSAAELQKLDKDRALELITQDGPEKILVYEIN